MVGHDAILSLPRGPAERLKSVWGASHVLLGFFVCVVGRPLVCSKCPLIIMGTDFPALFVLNGVIAYCACGFSFH